jgi:hypothetical protein
VKCPLPCVVLLALAGASGAFAGLLYDNTTTPTPDTVLYSAGAYTGIGDQIHLAAPGDAAMALLQFFNAGGAGTFDAELRFYQVGAPVGAQVGGAFALTGVTSTGGDTVNLQFALGGLALPQDVIFVASVINATDGMDLGLNLFEPPGAGSSDNTFLIVADSTGFSQASLPAAENVYFQLSDSAAPEPSTSSLLAAGLAAAALWLKRRPQRC